MALPTDENRPRSIRLTESELKSVVKDTVHETLVTLGVDAGDPIQVQQDMAHLRFWRKTTESAKTKGVLAVVGIVVAGGLSLAWMSLTGRGA